MRLFVLAQVIVAFIGSAAHAQYFGVGLYGGMQNCSVQIPEAIKSIEDDISDLQKTRRELVKERDRAKREKSKLDVEIKRSETRVKQVLKDEASNPGVDVALAVIQHFKSGTAKVTTEVCSKPESERPSLPWKKFCDGSGKLCQDDAASAADGGDYSNCNGDFSPEAKAWTAKFGEGGNYGAICSAVTVMVKAEYSSDTSNTTVSSRAREECGKGVDFLSSAYRKRDGLDSEFKAYDQEIKLIDLEIKARRDDKKYELEDYRERMANGETEGEFCYSCTYGNDRKLSTADRVGGILSTALIGAATYYGTKYAVDQNKRLGWPTSPWMAYGMGYPFIMAGIYGAAAGGAGGAYGCSGGGGMGGPFGYPPGVYGGGGMGGYPGAMIAGGFGMAGAMAGYPMAGGMYAPMGGMYAGYPMAGGMYAPMAGAFAGGMGIGGVFAGGGGYPGFYAGGSFPGMFAGGMAGAMAGGMAPFSGFGAPFATYGMPFPASGGMPFPGAGGAVAGGLGIGGVFTGGAYPGFYAGSIGGAFPGMMAGGFGMAGAMAGGMPMMGMYAGGMAGMYAGGMMMPMGGSMAAMQYQQQMLQMQQQQMQQWITEQQRMAQDYQNRTAMVGRLQSELYRIQMQIQMISSGGVSGGGYGYGGIGGGVGGGIPTGNVYPYPGDPNYQPGAGPGTIPARGRGYNP